MKTRLKDEERMKKNLSERFNFEITDELFKENVEYFASVADFIVETRDGNPKPHESASLTFSVDEDEIEDDEDYEVFVSYDFIKENEELIAVIDIDFEDYDDFQEKVIADINEAIFDEMVKDSLETKEE